jgi:hypothetical protein
VFFFLKRVSAHAAASRGTFVKTIGHEAMVTHKDLPSAERFIDSLAKDPALAAIRFRAAADFGSAYHFQFSKDLAADPYGPIVDRCARVAKLASAGAALATADYVTALKDKSAYVSAGHFSLKGISEPVELFIRSLVDKPPGHFMKPLLDAANQGVERRSGFKVIGRRLTSDFVRSFPAGPARPFLARELLNVPRFPYSPTEFAKLMATRPNAHHWSREHLGYFVEWAGSFNGYKRKDDHIVVTLDLSDKKEDPRMRFNELHLILPITFSDMVKAIPTGRRMIARGIITDVFMQIELNYVDLAFAD